MRLLERVRDTRLGRGFCVGLAVCGAALAASAGDDGATVEGCPAEAGPETAARVQARYDGIRDLAADFEQESRSASFGGQPLMDGDIKRGRVAFAKPGRMRWRYAEPEPSLVVSDGTTMWIHDVEGGTATRLEVTAGFLSGAALQFLLGDGKLLDTFEVEADRCDDARVELTLRPLEDASYERLGLVADAKTGDILETSVVDLFGNVTVIRFSGMEVDESPPDEMFTFDPPEGVELIDYAAEAAGGFDSAAP